MKFKDSKDVVPVPILSIEFLARLGFHWMLSALLSAYAAFWIVYRIVTPPSTPRPFGFMIFFFFLNSVQAVLWGSALWARVLMWMRRRQPESMHRCRLPGSCSKASWQVEAPVVTWERLRATEKTKICWCGRVWKRQQHRFTYLGYWWHLDKEATDEHWRARRDPGSARAVNCACSACAVPIPRIAATNASTTAASAGSGTAPAAYGSSSLGAVAIGGGGGVPNPVSNIRPFSPDPRVVVSPMLGWRQWLVSLGQGFPLYLPAWQGRAECVQDVYITIHSVHDSADIPAWNCSCGYYAHTIVDHQLFPGHPSTFGERVKNYDGVEHVWILGLVIGWGKVIRHADGWRSEYAKPLCFIIVPETTDIRRAYNEDVRSVAADNEVSVMTLQQAKAYMSEWDQKQESD